MTTIKKYIDNYFSYFFWSFVALLVSGSLLLLMQFFNEVKSFRFLGQGVEFRNTISVSGEGEVTVVPDTAEFSFAVVKEAKTVAEAQGMVTELMNPILAALKDFNIPEKNIKTLNYSLTPLYEFIDKRDAVALRSGVPTGERVLVGYEVSHFVEVKIKDIDGVGVVLANIGSLGATNISSINFTIEDEDVPQRDARKKAIKDAEEKARMLADDLGVRIIKIVNYSEGGGPIYYSRSMALSEGFGGDKGAESPEIPIGENKVTSYVTITYAIE
ncbi:MAG: SIMPL domain-containing protein [bacterium]|nr:SIMPL domain-containing protein [bacterium]